jgi:hypothetical protein
VIKTSSKCDARSALELTQAQLEKPSLRIVAGELERAQIRRAHQRGEDLALGRVYP